jgi:hypothetical protein
MKVDASVGEHSASHEAWTARGAGRMRGTGWVRREAQGRAARSRSAVRHRCARHDVVPSRWKRSDSFNIMGRSDLVRRPNKNVRLDGCLVESITREVSYCRT